MALTRLQMLVSPAIRKWTAPPCNGGFEAQLRHIAASKVQLGVALYLLSRRRRYRNDIYYGLLAANHSLGGTAFKCLAAIEADRKRRAAAAIITREALSWLYKPKGPMMRKGVHFISKHFEDRDLDDREAPKRESRAQVRSCNDHLYKPINWIQAEHWKALLRDQRVSFELYEVVMGMAKEMNSY